MLMSIQKTVTLPVPVDDAWAFLRDPERVAACLPNVRDFTTAGAPGRYAMTLVERLGPFSVQIALTLDVSEVEAERRMIADVSGEDRGGQARVRGEVTAAVSPSGEESILEVSSEVEVLGRMAALGAVPMRRRGDQVFEQFIETIGTRLGASRG
jgi:hypothetical protein